MGRYKKIFICMLLIIISVGAVVTAIYFKPITRFVAVKFWEAMFAPRHQTSYGYVGKDTVYVLGNGKFQILNIVGVHTLIMHRDGEPGTETLLDGISKYKKVNECLYIVSRQGYGVVNGNTNKCKLRITFPKSERVEDEHIQYLESYDDFSADEKMVFDGLKQF